MKSTEMQESPQQPGLAIAIERQIKSALEYLYYQQDKRSIVITFLTCPMKDMWLRERGWATSPSAALYEMEFFETDFGRAEFITVPGGELKALTMILPESARASIPMFKSGIHGG